MIAFIGMTGVYVFLSVLVGAIELITHLFPPSEKQPVSAGDTLSSPQRSDKQVVAVIQAAVTAFEADRRS
ncbi:OadG family protein [Novipirellula herctigrandis]